VRLSVSSGGRPIPVEEAERIFQPFHRVPGERRVPGVGLGLTICTRLMERLGGSIGVEPGTDSGNTFWIELRRAG
jgi:signal transduction histidine kinase